jgi:hypothetical protein
VFNGARLLPSGGIRVRLGARERGVLRTLPEQLRALLAEQELGPADPRGDVSAQIRNRLFPPAYDDPEFDAEYRELVGAELARERVGALDTFAETLAGGRSTATGWTVDLEPEQADAWLSATNDARLVLGVLAGITDESQWEGVVERPDPLVSLLLYLGWLQDELVGAMSGTLREQD